MVEEMKHEGKELEKERDFAWINAFLAGDEDSFDRLVLGYQDRVFNLCYRFLGDHEEADDCAQEVFVKIFRSLKRFRFDSGFATWLYAITVNTCKNRLKSVEYRYRKRMVPIAPVDAENKGALSCEIPDPAPSPLGQLTAKERRSLLHRAIDALPRDAKTVIILRDVDGLSYEEIATVTGYNPGTVKSKLARARQQLREMMKDA